MTLKIFCFKNDKNLVIFDLSTSKSPKLALPFTPIVQSINVWPKKYSGVIFHDTEGWCKIWRKIDLWIAKLTWGIWQILTWALESLKKFHFNVLLLSKVYIVWAKKYRGVIFHETEEGYKIWRGIDLSFQNWHKEFDKIWPEHSKVSKIFILMSSFWAKYILFELKKYRGVFLHETRMGYKIWRVINLLFQNWHKELTNFDLSTEKSQRFSL